MEIDSTHLVGIKKGLLVFYETLIYNQNNVEEVIDEVNERCQDGMLRARYEAEGLHIDIFAIRNEE